MNVKIDHAIYKGKTIFNLDSYKECSAFITKKFDSQELHIDFSEGPIEQEKFGIVVKLSNDCANYRLIVLGHYDIHFSGTISFGNPGRPMSLERRGLDIRAAYGPATSTVDNCLFDIQTDSLVEILGPHYHMKYDWENRFFRFHMHTGGNDIDRDFSILVHEHIYEQKFRIFYSPINHKTCFPTPPVGWMTWYAIQFNASEELVLKNALFLKEKLAPYGANAIWVDWEWYHQDFSGTNEPGIDTFNPDPHRYPNGLKQLATEIKSHNLIPALWIGATNDPNYNEFFETYPDSLLLQKRVWCGQYFIDPTHPEIKNEYIPRVFSNIKEMGYSALKWDCLPISFEIIDSKHDCLHDSQITTEEAMRDLVKIARRYVGDEFYMLSCSGDTLRDILFAGDIFDAARIGGDIFRWSEFVTSGVERIVKMYHLHNTLFYIDPDNVIIRPEFSNFEQAKSRVSIVSLLGLPFTIGDNLPELDDERLELIRQAIPVLDIHPMDIRNNLIDHRQIMINLAIATEWENWNIFSIINLLDEENNLSVSLQNDLHLDLNPDELYLLFDFWNREYLGTVNDFFNIRLTAYSSRVISVRKMTGIPQVLSTTRHLSQGALELEDIYFNSDTCVLTGITNLVPNDNYSIFIYVPGTFCLLRTEISNPFIGIERVNDIEENESLVDSITPTILKLNFCSNKACKIPWSVSFIPVDSNKCSIDHSLVNSSKELFSNKGD